MNVNTYFYHSQVKSKQIDGVFYSEKSGKDAYNDLWGYLHDMYETQNFSITAFNKI